MLLPLIPDPLSDDPGAGVEPVDETAAPEPTSTDISVVRAWLPAEKRAKATDAKIKEAYVEVYKEAKYKEKPTNDSAVTAAVKTWLEANITVDEAATPNPGLPDGAPDGAEALTSGELPANFLDTNAFYKLSGKIKHIGTGLVYSYNGGIVYVEKEEQVGTKMTKNPNASWDGTEMIVVAGAPNEHLLPTALREKQYRVDKEVDGIVHAELSKSQSSTTTITIAGVKYRVGSFTIEDKKVIEMAVLNGANKEIKVKPNGGPTISPLDPDLAWTIDSTE